jgi:hypothetical protein
MYKWYWDAAICYAYLSDVSDGPARESELESSRGFTRGWTLQELLAPDVVESYDAQWRFRGTKAKLVRVIAEVTKIDRKFVLSRETIEDASIGTKFSWTAARKTTRTEDMAYCMLGIMHVNMPMLYGEGERAFYRLQLEIIRHTNDHSIFAWEPVHTGRQITTILAPSPTCFEKSAGIRPAMPTRSLDASTYEVTNNGLRATLAVIRISQDRLIALLGCETDKGDKIGVWLEAIADGKYQRLSGSRLAKVSVEEAEEAELLNMYLVLRNEREDKETRRPHELVISDILANYRLFVHGITVSTRYTTTIVQDVRPFLFFGDSQVFHEKVLARMKISEDQVRYLLHKFVLQEGEVACIRLTHELYDMDSRFMTIVIGLQNGKPLLRSAFSNDTSWSDELQKITTGIWDLAGDYTSIVSDSGCAELQVRAKKSLVNGKLLWHVVVEVGCCKCGNDWTDSSPFCTCPPIYSQDPDRTK